MRQKREIQFQKKKEIHIISHLSATYSRCRYTSCCSVWMFRVLTTSLSLGLLPLALSPNPLPCCEFDIVGCHVRETGHIFNTVSPSPSLVADGFALTPHTCISSATILSAFEITPMPQRNPAILVLHQRCRTLYSMCYIYFVHVTSKKSRI